MLEYAARYELSWLGVLLLAWLLRFFARDPWHKAFGFALMTWPLWLSMWGFVNSIEVLTNSGSVLRAYSPEALTNIAVRGLMRKTIYVAAGAVLYTKAWTAPSWDELKSRLPAIPMGKWAGTERRSLAAGFLVFPVFLAVSAFLNWLVYASPILANGDESSVWANMTPLHNVAISFQAAFGEELLYRAVLLIGLLRFMPAWAAIAIQAVVFGLAHSSYGTWAHVLVPTAFGLFAGVAVWYTGFWSIVVIHFLIDIYAFGGDTALNAPWFEGFLLLSLAGMAAATVRWLGARLLQYNQRRAA